MKSCEIRGRKIQWQVFLQETQMRDMQREKGKAVWTWKQKLKLQSQKLNPWSHQKLEEAKKDSLIEPQERTQDSW